jgi:hypothetical protein
MKLKTSQKPEKPPRRKGEESKGRRRRLGPTKIVIIRIAH